MSNDSSMNQAVTDESKSISMYGTIITIGEVNIEIDGSDPDFIESLQGAWKKIQAFKAPEGVSDTEKTRMYIDSMDAMFDAVFGEGVSKKAFKTRSLIKRLHAWDAIFNEIKEQEEAMQQASELFNTKYNAKNRAARRAASKKSSMNRIGS